MGLSGIQIFKLLPKTNCKDCGVPTCLAFAMNLAAGKAELSACPHVSDEAKSQLDASSAPPVRTVTVGAGPNTMVSGGETVLFRHEKTFFNKTGLAVLIADDESPDQVDGKLKRLAELQYERVGVNLRGEGVALKSNTGDVAAFKALAEKVKATDAAPILMSDNIDVLKAGIEVLAAKKPLLYAATADTLDEMVDLAKGSGCSLVIKADGLDALLELTKKAMSRDFVNIVLDPGSRKLKQSLKDLVGIRRLAIEKTLRELGYPVITFPCEMTDDFMLETTYAAMLIPKYAGLMVLSDFQGESLFPLLLERLNIFTDPQRPMKTEQKVYEINGPGATSPVLVTANFSLTYFIVSGEIEASRVPTHLVVVDTDGLSVLTAWAAGKFVGDVVGSVVNKLGVGDNLTTKKLVLPGYAAIILGDTEEELGSDWEVMVGPRESAHIPAYLKQNFA